MKKNFNFISICLILFFAGVCSFNVNGQSFTASISVFYDDSNHCTDNGVTLLATPNDNTLFSYVWTCPGGNCPNGWVQNNSFANFWPTFTQPTIGIYTVLITEISTGDTATAQASVSTYPKPNAGYSVPSINGCEGTQMAIHASYNNPAYGPYTYSWNNGAPTSVDSVAFTFGPSFLFAPDIIVTNGYGCSQQNSSTLWLFGSPTPLATISAIGSTTFCAGGSVELLGEATHPSHSLLNLTYQWKKYSAFQSDTDSSFSATATGRYRFIASANGCPATSNFIDVTVNPLPTVTVNPSGQAGYCIGQPVILTATSPTATSYQWKRYGNILGGQVSSSLSVSTAGKYKAIVQDANGCIRASAPIEVVGPPNNQVSASGPLTFCQGDSVTFTAATGYSYQWKKRTNGNYVDIPSATNQSYTATATGKYKVFVTNNSTGCTVSSAVKTVNVNCRVFGEQLVESEVEMNVYPNPFLSQLTISFNEIIQEEALISIYDLTGRIIFQTKKEISNEGILELSTLDFKNGMYLLEVITNENKYKQLMVKEQ